MTEFNLAQKQKELEGILQDLYVKKWADERRRPSFEFAQDVIKALAPLVEFVDRNNKPPSQKGKWMDDEVTELAVAVQREMITNGFHKTYRIDG